ncbi:MAG: putative metalloprotease CJM1_0395 family protein [Hydrogenovibrio sp.]
MDIASSAMPFYSNAYPSPQMSVDALASSPTRKINVSPSISDALTQSTNAQSNPFQTQADSRETNPQVSDADTGQSRNSASSGSSSESNPSDGQTPADPSISEKAAQLEVERVVMQLKSRDMEVRAHEQAHVAAGGQYVTSGASYAYQTGPDGKRYAVGGEVGIDTSPISGDPQATLAKAQQVRAAALAPAEPSSQDMRVAAQATQMAAQARAELAASQSPSSEAEDTEATTESATESITKSSAESTESAASSPLFNAQADASVDLLNGEASTRTAWAVTMSEDRADQGLANLVSSGEKARNQFEIRLLNQSA